MWRISTSSLTLCPLLCRSSLQPPLQLPLQLQLQLPLPLLLPLPLRFLLSLLLTSLPFFGFILIPPKDLALRRLTKPSVYKKTPEIAEPDLRSFPPKRGWPTPQGRQAWGRTWYGLLGEEENFFVKSEVWGETGTPKVGIQP